MRQLIKPLVFFSFFCTVIQLSCETELFELEKLSNDTGLTPSVKLPVAKADIQLNSFLDRLDFNVDYERDDYATIYVSDSIQRLVETSIEDIYDPTALSSEVESTNTLSPVELENITNYFNRISMS